MMASLDTIVTRLLKHRLRYFGLVYVLWVGTEHIGDSLIVFNENNGCTTNRKKWSLTLTRQRSRHSRMSVALLTVTATDQCIQRLHFNWQRDAASNMTTISEWSSAANWLWPTQLCGQFEKQRRRDDNIVPERWCHSERPGGSRT